MEKIKYPLEKLIDENGIDTTFLSFKDYYNSTKTEECLTREPSCKWAINNFLKECLDTIRTIRDSELKPGNYLFKVDLCLSERYSKLEELLFVFDGKITDDGYGIALGFDSDGQLYKTPGGGSVCYKGDVRRAIDDEIEYFIEKITKYQKPIETYPL